MFPVMQTQTSGYQITVSPASASANQLEDLLSRVMLSGQLSSAEHQQLKAALATKELLTTEQQAVIRRLFYGIQQGVIRLQSQHSEN